MKYWSSSDKNFGDALTPFLLNKLKIKHEFSNYPDMIGAGSIIEFSDVLKMKDLYVWGSGFLNEFDKIPQNKVKYLAVRGKLSAKKLNLRSVTLGDPGLLTSRCFPINTKKKYKIGIVCHCTDFAKFNKIIKDAGLDIPVINAQFKHKMTEDDLLNLLTKINECEFIYSSSLHGIIVAHSYGIPAIYLRDLKNMCRHDPHVISSDDFKFKDYYSSIDLNYNVINWSDDLQFLNESLDVDQLCPKKEILQSIQTKLIYEIRKCDDEIKNKKKDTRHIERDTYLYF